MKKYAFLLMIGYSLLCSSCSYDQPEYNPIRKDDINEEQPGPEDPDEEVDVPDIYPEEDYELIWSDEFDGDDEDLDARWNSQNGPSSHILCSRWRENAVISDGTLKLVNRKENRGGQEWTSGNIWTKEHFLYGYYECRYRYAAAQATNNSFWIMSQNGGAQPEKGSNFEIDINEGHYPNEVNTNIHNWSGQHTTNSKGFMFGTEPGYSFQLENPIRTTKIRFSSNHNKHFHIREFRILSVAKGYSEPLSDEWETIEGVANYAKEARITASGCYNEGSNPISNVCDGKTSTSWVSQAEGEKWLQFEFTGEKTIGCIQFVNGWQQGESWNDLIGDYKVQYEKDGKWVDIATKDITKDMNFAKDYHTYGLDWTEEELVFYFDRKEIRRVKNEFCFSAAPVWLSLAIVSWAGEVTDAIDGTQMEVDYVRIYKHK